MMLYSECISRYTQVEETTFLYQHLFIYSDFSIQYIVFAVEAYKNVQKTENGNIFEMVENLRRLYDISC